MKTKISQIFFVIFFATIVSFSLLSVACNMTPASISPQAELALCQQVEKKPIVILFEGLQPLCGNRMKKLGEELSLAKGFSVCATSGNHDAHMPIIRQAHKYYQKIYIVGFSLGEAEALNLAEDCGKEGIPVEKLFLLDGVQKLKVNSRVKHVVDIVGTNPYKFRRAERYQKSDLGNNKTDIKYRNLNCYHLEIPANSRAILLAEIH